MPRKEGFSFLFFCFKFIIGISFHSAHKMDTQKKYQKGKKYFSFRFQIKKQKLIQFILLLNTNANNVYAFFMFSFINVLS
jgi:hypothetical protein